MRILAAFSAWLKSWLGLALSCDRMCFCTIAGMGLSYVVEAGRIPKYKNTVVQLDDGVFYITIL